MAPRERVRRVPRRLLIVPEKNEVTAKVEYCVGCEAGGQPRFAESRAGTPEGGGVAIVGRHLQERRSHCWKW